MEVVFSADYVLDRKNAAKAAIQFHFAKSKVKTIIYTVILFLLAVLFTVSALFFEKQTSRGSSWFLAAVSLITLFMTYEMPVSQAKTFSQKYGDGVDFTAQFFENGVKIISADRTETLLEFDKLSSFTCLKDFFVFQYKDKTFPIPKDVFDESSKKFITEKAEKINKEFKK